MRLGKPFTLPDYGRDPWVIEISGMDDERTGLHETVFALSNGHIGARGSFEQGAPVHHPGVLVNGFYETWPIEYPEAGYAYAVAGQTIVYAPDTTGLAILSEGRPLRLTDARVVRRLDLRTGILTTTAAWPRAQTIEWERLVSLTRRQVVAIRVSWEGATATPMSVESGWRNRQDTDYLIAGSEFDPRRAKSFGQRVLEATKVLVGDHDATLAFRTVRSRIDLAIAFSHSGFIRAETSGGAQSTDDTKFVLVGSPIEKKAAYVLTPHPEEAEAALEASPDFSGLAAEQEIALDEFWSHAAIEIGADPSLQQAVNWAIFQLHQSSAQLDGRGIPAKGLTGQSYEGHYFWDTDIFVLPFLAHHAPAAAAELIRFRHSLLPAARRRARELSHTGALFPWRTINGDEASAYYEAGTAQYHIDAAVVYGMSSYLEATGDESLLWECGVEIAAETARFWVDLGFFQKRNNQGSANRTVDGSFHIHMCTGPDEYSALVDDNAYTNYMARFNLVTAVEWTRRMAAEHPGRFLTLSKNIGLDLSEIDTWAMAAAAMELPIDPKLGITPQDARFLEREPWDWNTPAEKYPLLLNFHPLVIYRHQVLKQADVVMAMFLLPEEFSRELTRANFEYYDPITTGDSSLSPPIEAAVAARIGRFDLAVPYFRHAAFLDLANLAGNSVDGVHLATAGGLWQALVFGFGGFRSKDGQARLEPHLPPEWDHLRFAVSVRGSRLQIEVSADQVSVSLASGESVNLEILGKSYRITDQLLEVPR